MNSTIVTCIESCIEEGKKLDIYSTGTLLKDRNPIFLIILGVILTVFIFWRHIGLLSSGVTKTKAGAKNYFIHIMLTDILTVICILLLIFIASIYL